ncbi:MAG TPA: ABC transporter permease, partial [Bryobacteraceae bacterium]
MTEAWLLFVRLILRPLRREPLRTGLTTFAVALGVGVVVAIDLAGQAAAGSFHSSLESLAGKSDLQLSATGGLDQNLLGRLVQLPYAFTFSPRVGDFASINGKGEAFPFIGLDLIGHPPKQNLAGGDLNKEASQLDVGEPIGGGKQRGLRVGERVRLLINDRTHEFTVRGVLQHGKGEVGEDTAIVADIGLAQRVTGKSGKL